MKKNYEIKEETHDFEGRTMTDLVCYFGDKRFVLVPLTQSKRVKSYFYALLKGEAKQQTKQ